MAKQPPHGSNANIYHEVEKVSRDTITLARKVVKNTKSITPQILSLEDPITVVGDLSELACTLLEILEEQGVVSHCSIDHKTFSMMRSLDLNDFDNAL
jgi:ribosomal protein S25